MKKIDKQSIDIAEIFAANKTIAVVGMSQFSFKAAHSVPMFFRSEGYEIIPVNPNADNINGLECFDSIHDVAKRVDIVNVFRPSADAEFVLRDVLRRRFERRDVNVLWLQEGIFTEEGARLCAEAGIKYIENKCMYKEYFAKG